MSKTADRLDRIETLLEELVTLLRALVLQEGSEEGDYPIPATPYTPHLPQPLDPVAPLAPPVFPVVPDLSRKTTCTKCGMTFEGVMGYVCNTPGCPMGCGPITC